jgi:glycerol kinase
MIASICKRELEREALGKLPRLAAKGAYLEPGDAGTRAVLNLMSPRNDHSAPVAKWERDLVDAFHRYGWVEHDPLGRTVLSNGGRAWLAAAA